MFKDNTVFVIGAGASAEFGLPVGWQLLKTIKDNCHFELDMWRQLKDGPTAIFRHYERVFGRETEDGLQQFLLRLKACEQIKLGIDSADSIDEYIYRYSGNPIISEVGKLQIAYAISLAEKNSTLARGFVDYPPSLDETWIWSFTKALINGIRADDVNQIGQNITIICFNYDRCIEHYLEHALARSFEDLTPKAAREIVSNINIIHPYGWLGDLELFPFGTADAFPAMAGNLITWSESVRDPEIVAKMREAIREAEQIVFMGFGFAAQNMDLLNSQPEKTDLFAHEITSTPDVYATALGIPEEVEGSLKSKITDLYMEQWSMQTDQGIHFQYGATCKKFFDIHRLNLVK
ncbi:hypothetical protein G6L13_19020 [Agrobacterium tumefaciens]|uniref:hypothetical protein n=1 Tax=Agrobacterium tumefaciens TaxID=358 RepID=UPI00157262CF|nr:hypothetical protein [Agrobacterium tumefaciens]NTA82591.1 hypothetical protein [Agrobacterium tumefaciens]